MQPVIEKCNLVFMSTCKKLHVKTFEMCVWITLTFPTNSDLLTHSIPQFGTYILNKHGANKIYSDYEYDHDDIHHDSSVTLVAWFEKKMDSGW